MASTPSVATAQQPVPPLEAAESLRERVTRWIIRGSIAGFIISLAVHITFLAVAAIWRMGTAQAGGAGDRDLGGEVQMAIMTEAELGAIEEAMMDVTTPSVAEASPEALQTPEVLDGPAAAGEAPAAGDIGSLSEDVTGAGGDIGESVGLGETGAGGGAASFFGVEAVGTRFAYIVDISGSMQGPKLRELKVEIIESTDALAEHMQFFVVPYSTEAVPLGGREKWTRADDRGKEWVRDRVNELNSFGGTNPLPGFQLVFDITPRPDAIYFMTDGIFDPEVAVEIAKMNKRGKRVPIHTIGFDMQDAAAEELLKRIAEESGGRYSPVGYPGAKK